MPPRWKCFEATTVWWWYQYQCKDLRCQAKLFFLPDHSKMTILFQHWVHLTVSAAGTYLTTLCNGQESKPFQKNCTSLRNFLTAFSWLSHCNHSDCNKYFRWNFLADLLRSVLCSNNLKQWKKKSRISVIYDFSGLGVNIIAFFVSVRWNKYLLETTWAKVEISWPVKPN